ncbi:hypothetical protein VTK56DRAFT_9393 [Thermocarpiscus australiensis]
MTSASNWTTSVYQPSPMRLTTRPIRLLLPGRIPAPSPSTATSNIFALRCSYGSVEQDEASRFTNHLYYRLDNSYREDQFPPQAFVGRDQLVVEAIRQLVAQLPLEAFLAVLDREDSANVDPVPSYLVRDLVDLQGHRLTSDLPVAEQNWVQTRLPPLKASSSDCEVAVMLVPRDSVVDFMMRHVEIPAGLTSRYGLQIPEAQGLIE